MARVSPIMTFQRGEMGGSPRKYILVDGAFLEKICEEYGRHLDCNVFEKIHWDQFAADAGRLIYYDALPVQKDDEDGTAFQAKLDGKMRFFNSLRANDGFHVRDGITRLKRGKGKSSTLEQKAVDTWMAVDALQYSWKGIVDYLDIYTSDVDLYPLFEVLLQTNTRTTLFYQEGRTSEELIYAADAARPITVSMMFHWMQHDCPEKFRRLETESLNFVPTYLDRFNSSMGELSIGFERSTEQWFFQRKVGDKVTRIFSEYLMIIIDEVRKCGGNASYTSLDEYVRRAGAG